MDKRVIQKVKAYHKGLEIINNLKPVEFEYKNGCKQDLGLIGQDVSTLDPALVKNNVVDYDKLIIVLINSIKTLSEEIEQLKSKKKK
jgi:hypothetical protein